MFGAFIHFRPSGLRCKALHRFPPCRVAYGDHGQPLHIHQAGVYQPVNSQAIARFTPAGLDLDYPTVTGFFQRQVP